MEHYILFYKDNVLGVYSNYDKAKLYVLSCFQNGLLHENVIIKVYQKNSCYLLREETLSNNKKPIQKLDDNKLKTKVLSEMFKNNVSPIVGSFSKVDNKQMAKLAEDKIKIQHNLNMLKKQKERLHEREQIYNTDLELFNKFYKIKTENNTFEIPELFTKKYDILLKLKESNTLSCNNFYKEYQPINNYSDFAPNNYESKTTLEKLCFSNQPSSDDDSENDFDNNSDSDNEEFTINKMTKSLIYEDDSDYLTSVDGDDNEEKKNT